jgi:hypothetical protein
MAIFVSYARKDRAVVETLRHDLERGRLQVWLDDELTGGQAWWDTILGQIRACQLFVFALSPDSLRSKACQAELQYALSLNRPLLAVMVKSVSVQLAPAPIANSQIVDYTERTADSAVALVTSAATQPPPPPLPSPLPPAPPPPLSYLNPYREQIQSRDLPYRDQAQLVISLRGHLQDEDERETASILLTELRRRPDIAESVARDIDDLLAARPAAGPGPWGGTATTTSAWSGDRGSLAPPTHTAHGGSTPDPVATGTSPTGTSQSGTSQTGTSAAAAGWYADPYRRFEHRYWDGGRWTDQVSTGGQASVDRPSNQPAVATSAGPEGGTPFSGGAFAALLIATLFIPLIGIIVGAVNLKIPARRGQAQGLLWVGIASFVLGFIILSSGM